AWARVPSPAVAPGEGLALEIGEVGTVAVESAEAVTVSWQADDGRDGRAVLPAGGGVVPTGPGRVRLSIDAGPAWQAAEREVVVPAGGEVAVEAALEPAFSVGRRVLVALPWHGDRSRTHRGT